MSPSIAPPIPLDPSLLGSLIIHHLLVSLQLVSLLEVIIELFKIAFDAIYRYPGGRGIQLSTLRLLKAYQAIIDSVMDSFS